MFEHFVLRPCSFDLGRINLACMSSRAPEFVSQRLAKVGCRWCSGLRSSDKIPKVHACVQGRQFMAGLLNALVHNHERDLKTTHVVHNHGREPQTR